MKLKITYLYERKVKVKSLSHVQLFATPWTVPCQAPPSVEFSRQEYWSGLPFPSPGDLLTQGLNSSLQHCRQTLYRLSHQGSPIYTYIYIKHRSIHISNIFKYILKYVNIYQTIYSLNICKYVFKVYKDTLSWPKSSFRYLCSIMCKNPNELFGQSAYIF